MMPNFKDLTGQKFGKLTVMGIARKTQSGKRERYYWKCTCECGNIKEVRTDCLTTGYVRSCGCLKKEQDKINLRANHRHKLSNTHIWYVYYGMLHRCYNKKNNRYECYGGRGIRVCEEWKCSFDKFAEWAMDNGYANGLQIDRIDNDGNYEPSNCRWVTPKVNCRNRSSNTIVEYEGHLLTLIELSEKLNLSYSTVRKKYAKYGIKRKDM